MPLVVPPVSQSFVCHVRLNMRNADDRITVEQMRKHLQDELAAFPTIMKAPEEAGSGATVGIVVDHTNVTATVCRDDLNDDTLQMLADIVYENFNFQPASVEATDGWEYNEPNTHMMSRMVYLTRPFCEDEPTEKFKLWVEFFPHDVMAICGSLHQKFSYEELTQDLICPTCGTMKGMFTHDCLGSADSHELFGCPECDDYCIFCKANRPKSRIGGNGVWSDMGFEVVGGVVLFPDTDGNIRWQDDSGQTTLYEKGTPDYKEYLDLFTSPISPVSVWMCPECEQYVVVDKSELATIGTPFCTDCDKERIEL